MEPKSDSETIGSKLKKRRIASSALWEAKKLLIQFEEDQSANKRLAVVVTSILVVILFGLYVYEKFEGDVLRPDRVMDSEVIYLGKKEYFDDQGNRIFFVSVKLENGEQVWATVNKELFDSLKAKDKVEVGRFDYFETPIYRILGKKEANVP